MLDRWKDLARDLNTLANRRDIERYVELTFPKLKKWHKRILSAAIAQVRFSSVSIAKEIHRKTKFVNDYFITLQERLEDMGIYPKLIFNQVDKRFLTEQERKKHRGADVYELSKEFVFLQVGTLVPFATKLQLATGLATKILASLELKSKGFVGRVKEGPAWAINLLGEVLILGTWFHLVQITRKSIRLIMKEGSIFKEYPLLFDIFAAARDKGVKIGVVITKDAGIEIMEKFRDIDASLRIVDAKQLEEEGLENIRLAIHDDEHVIYLEKISEVERKAIYFRLKPHVLPLSDYIQKFNRLFKSNNQF